MCRAAVTRTAAPPTASTSGPTGTGCAAPQATGWARSVSACDTLTRRNRQMDDTQTIVLLIEVGVIALASLLRILGQRG